MAVRTVLGLVNVKGIGAATNFRYKSVNATPVDDPLPPPPDPRDFVCVENTGFIGDGTYYIMDAYCIGFGGWAENHTVIPSSLEAEYNNVVETPVVLDSSPIASDANVGNTPIILEGIQEFAIV